MPRNRSKIGDVVYTVNHNTLEAEEELPQTGPQSKALFQKERGAGELAQCVRACTALAEDLSAVSGS